jgi:hypothetical protein
VILIQPNQVQPHTRSNSSNSSNGSNSIMVKMLKEKSLEDQVKKSIPANVLVISGAKADQMKSEVFDVDEFELPKNKGKQGGMLTSAWLQVMNRNATVTTEKITWVDMLKGTKQTLEEQGYNNQIPQVASSRKFSVKTEMLLFPKGGKKRALLIGIQYRDHGDGQLKNSHEQVEAMKQYLIKVHKFPKQKIDVLLDNDGSERDPTRKNILNSMRNLTKETQAGDTAFVLFCGHAGRIFGREDEETIIPVDFGSSGQIRQDEIYKALICAMPAKSNLVCLFDLAK